MFTGDPAAGCICAICHDVLERASSIRECGHTFCEQCAESSLEASATCPNCRASATTGVIPNYFARDAVDGLEVKCPNWNGGGEDSTKKRKRGDDGVASSLAGCEWRGQLKDLKDHEVLCDFKLVKCSVDGCSHMCLNKDMEAHLNSGASTLAHLQLMQKSFNKRIESVESKCEEKVEALKREVKDMESYTAKCEERINAIIIYPSYSVPPRLSKLGRAQTRCTIRFHHVSSQGCPCRLQWKHNGSTMWHTGAEGI